MISFGEELKLNEDQQKRLVDVATEAFTNYETLLEQPRQRMLEQFEDTFIFKFERGKGRSSLCFPKMYEYLQRIAPRLVANNPKWVVNPKAPKRKDDTEVTAMTKKTMFEMARGSQLYMNYIWDLGRCRAKLDEWSISGLVQDIGWACVDFVQNKEKVKEVRAIEVEMEDGEISIEEEVEEVEVEKVTLEYPTFQALDSLTVYFDPRITFVDDQQSVIVYNDSVFISDLLENKDLYYPESVEKLYNIGGTNDLNSKQSQKFTQQGIPDPGATKQEKVAVKYFFGYFCVEQTDEGKPDYDSEKLVFASIVNDQLVLECKEIPFYPLESFSPSRVPSQAIGVGAMRPIHSLHKAYNLVKNQRFDNVNLVINRMWKMKQGAGVDPRKLKSLPGNVIPMRDLDAIEPLETPDVTASSYREAQDLDADMQTTTGTISTTESVGENSFVNTATGQKIRWNEFNARFNYYKDNLEDALGRLGMKMLMLTGERASMNPIIADPATEKFYEIAKEYFNDFQDYFSVGVLADSTTYDSIANQRDEALAKAKISQEYQGQGVPIDMTKVYMDVMKTFPGTNPEDYIIEGGTAPSPQSPSSVPAQMPTSSDAIAPPSLTP